MMRRMKADKPINQDNPPNSSLIDISMSRIANHNAGYFFHTDFYRM